MRLNRGDIVSIVAPASQFRGADRPLLDRAVDLLRDWGLKPIVRAEDGHFFYLAGSDRRRAHHLLAALGDDSKAIFCTRGGYGAARLLPLMAETPDPRARFLVGYSDATSLALAAARLWPSVQVIHGPNIATRQLLDDTEAAERNRLSLRAALFEPDYYISEEVEFLVPGAAKAPLCGGCLSLVAAAAGTAWSLDARDRLLFLEDTGEAPYRIDRMLTQLKNAGALDGVRGILFGVMRNCTDPYNDLREILRDLLAPLHVPVAFGLRSGHGDWNLSLPLGSAARLDSRLGKFEAGALSVR